MENSITQGQTTETNFGQIQMHQSTYKQMQTGVTDIT